MKTMGITTDMLQESNTGFHGIIPTLPAYPLGKISMDVVFGKPDNFRKERLELEVVNGESQYHAILGRPAYAKFMAVPHSGYLMLKMPGNNRTTITVRRSLSRSDNCDKDFQKIASKFEVKEELNALDDHFPLPHIDQIVNSTAGCERLSLLEAYSGYNQMKLKEEDQ
ncbi:uncharacterized protein [Lolium perenne]|uniref:uncharacterized protein n=1 Tax=Lolium perenne TaxID=4522 RepID=UPI0021F52506|nr:uncharacterized protein LOC127310043 [Lolium perenne]